MSNQMYESFLYESELGRSWTEDPIDYKLLNTVEADSPDLHSAADSVDNSEDETKEMLKEVSRPRVRVQVHGGILRHDFT